MDARDIVTSTAEPAFATDEKGRLVLWNAAAAAFLNGEPEVLAGKPCHEILRGTDLFGNRHCCEKCTLHQMIRRREAVHDFVIDVDASGGVRRRVSVSIVVVPGIRPARYWVVHILKPAVSEMETDVAEPARLRGDGDGSGRGEGPRGFITSGRIRRLTTRELEILELMAQGNTTPEIGEQLCISTTTVRNHIQHILRKLDVHTKVQAVSLALRRPQTR